MPGTKPNIVIFGDAGGGKSSMVNLLLNQEVAEVSDRAVGCTFKFKKYETSKYFLFDTVGLSEGRMGTMQQKDAVGALIDLMKSLKDGISALIFVMEKGRIKQTLNENYKLFVQTICVSKVPVVLMITHCEMELEHGQWWKENQSNFDKYEMHFDAVVSGCCMTPDKAPPVMQPVIKALYDSTATELHEAINKVKLVPGWTFKGGWMPWFNEVMRGVLKSIGSALLDWFPGNDGRKVNDRIVDYFLSHGYESPEAKEMANELLLHI